MSYTNYKTVLLIIFLTGSYCMNAQQESKSTADKEKWADKGVHDKDIRMKEISIETPCAPDGIVFLEDIYRQIIVRTANDNKVKIVTMVYYRGEPRLTDAEWFALLDLEFRGSNSQVVIKNQLSIQGQKTKMIADKMRMSQKGRIQKEGLQNQGDEGQTSPPRLVQSSGIRSAGTGIANFDSAGNWTNKKSNIKRDIIVYIPSGATLDIETRFNDIMIENNLKEVKVHIYNASLGMADAEKATIRGDYATIKAGNFKKASVEMNNGRLAAKNIEKLSIDSRSSTIEFVSCPDLFINSHDDQYEIDEVGILRGEKNFGDLRITTLKKSFELKGNNTNIKIRYIASAVTHVNIEDKYADIRLPLGNLVNYAVDFEGAFSNVYTPFEKQFKKNTPVQEDNKMPKTPEAPAPQNANFTGTAGDIKGSHLQLKVKCSNCTVDFK
jgi:hypothetical protein